MTRLATHVDSRIGPRRPVLGVRRDVWPESLAQTVLALLIVAAGMAPVWGQGNPPPRSEAFFPASTVGYLAVPNVHLLREAWRQTKFGELLQKPMMEPFTEELQRWLDQEFSQLDRRLGLKWKDLEDVQGGELAIGLSPVGNNKNAIGFMMDVAAKGPQARELLGRIDQELTAQQVKRRQLTVGGAPVVEYTFPPRRERLLIHKAYYTVHRDWLVAADHLSMLKHLIQRLDGAEGPCLREAPTYAAVMDPCRTAAGSEPHLRWYMEPFALARALREAAAAKHKTRYTEAFERQGFDVIRGLGGCVLLHEDDRDLTHYTYIYAPGPGGGQQRFRLAARMLDFPNRENFDPPTWIPEDAASVLTLHWRMKEAFNFSATLVNELADDEVFEDVLESIRRDENGPQIDIRKEIVSHLTEQAWMVTRIHRPIEVRSEWKLLAFGIDDDAAVASAVERALKNDPYARRREGHPEIWEIFEKPAGESPQGFGFGANGRKPEERLIKNGAIAVLFNHLMFATDARFLEQIKLSAASPATVRNLGGFRRVLASMARLGPGANAGRFFIRHQLIQEANYELARQGQLPNAKTTLGQLINWLSAPQEKELLREQRLDGSKLPEFSQIVGYLGLGGVAARTEPDGWMIWGCLLPP